jgi:NADH-quinone oxidoreductase subunit H
MPLLNKWYDLRDLGNPVRALLEQMRDWGAPDWAPYVAGGVIGIAGILLWLLISQLAFIWIERRVIALMQNRKGPNRVGPMGLLQPIADALKLLMKEAITVRGADRVLFWIAPVLIFIPALVVFAVVPFGEGMVLADLNVGVLFFVAISSINTVAVFAAGWSSNNKYSLLGAMRQIAMLISYELVQVFALLSVVVFAGTMRMQGLVLWQSEHDVWLFFIMPLALVTFLFAGAVEINRSPADISEAESEIVAGYHTEYSGLKFGFFYAAEYFAGFAIAAITATVFLGGWTLWGLEEWVPGWLIFLTKLYLVFFLFIWMRGTLPRLRIDQLMAFSWKFLLEILFIHVMVVGAQAVIWAETGWPPEVALPIFAAVNWALAAAMVVGWALMLGHTDRTRRGERAILTQEVGAVFYEGA